jgi:hypothetical protein
MYTQRTYKSALALLFFLSLLAPSSSLLHAATVTWTGNAADVKQITTITVAGTWLSTETATLTINGKGVTVTLVGDESTANVATALKDAWNAGSRLDGTGNTDATSNAGGQEFGEFTEATASVSGSVVTIIANTPGVPITITASETSTSGTLTPATAQTATGKHFWDNAKNWDTGTVPANDDTVVFRDSDVSVKYGLPNASLEVTLLQYMTYTGEIGLPPTNVTNTAKPYPEYRQRYVRLDDAGTGTNIAHRFGIGAGNGSPLINVRHTTVKISPVVYNTGTPLPSRLGTHALNLCATTNTSTINIAGGSVDFSSQDGQTSAWAVTTQTGGNSRCLTGIHTSSANVHLSGGMLLLGQSGNIASINLGGGTLRMENQTGTIAEMNIRAGLVQYVSTGTITSLSLYTEAATFDAREGAGDFTVTAAALYSNASYLDPFARTNASSDFFILFEPSERLQFGGSIARSLEITLP